MILVESLSNYNYAISFKGLGPPLYDFTKEDIDQDIQNEIKLLMGEHLNKLESLATFESVEDGRFNENIMVFNLSIYVVFRLNAEDHIEECLLTLGDYMERSFIKNIITD